MKIRILIFTFILLSIVSQGQNNKYNIFGSWVKVNAVYNSGESLPINHSLNQSYYRIEFKKDGKAFKTTQPLENGFIFDYSISGEKLKIGFINYQIEYLSKDTLILIEEGISGFDDSSLKYILESENNYQRSIPLSSDMIIFSGSDSIFIENEKVRAYFRKNQSYREFLSENIPEYSNVITSDNFFMATFIINSGGSIDSIKIHKGINKKFDNQFIKATKKSSRFWDPARLNDKNVSVLHTETFKFISNPVFENVYYNYKDGILLMHKGEFIKAIPFFNKCLEENPHEIDALYNRGICYYKLNKFEEACLDWKKIKSFKSKKADNLINEFCK